MNRIHQISFLVSLVGLSWLGMMAIHELGHVIGAMATGGSIRTVVLHPMTFSRTDVSPNPWPSIVVWLGPILGAGLPLIALALFRKNGVSRNISRFFAGFCLIANGAYIALGSIDRIGDCGVMLKHGTPLWSMYAFGIVTIPAGFWIWHQLGAAGEFLANPQHVTKQMAIVWSSIFAMVLIAEFVLSPMN